MPKTYPFHITKFTIYGIGTKIAQIDFGLHKLEILSMKTLYKPTGQIFNSRKEAKEILGGSFYRNALKYGDITFITTDTFASDGSISSTSKPTTTA